MKKYLFTPAEAAELLNCHPDTLRLWRRAGTGPPVTFLSNRLIRYSSEDLAEYVASVTR